MKLELDEPGVYFVQHFVAQLESRGGGPDARTAALEVASRRTTQRFGTTGAISVDSLAHHGEAVVATLRATPELRADPKRYKAALKALQAEGHDPGAVMANVASGAAQLRALIVAGPRARDVLDVVAAQPAPSHALVEELHRLLVREPFNPQATVEFLAEHTGIGEILHEWSGVFESYSIGVHTERFYERYLEQRRFLDLEKLGLPDGIRFDRVMRFVAPLHDIGKAAAVETGDRGAQHEYTVPVLRHLFEGWGFTPAELRLAQALVDNDVIGHVVNPSHALAPEAAAKILADCAASAGVSLPTFFALQTFFFVVDASSYPWLEKVVFARDEHGKLWPRSAQFASLAALCSAGAPS